MKKILSIVILLSSILIMSGCSKDYQKVSYTTFNEYFSKQGDYKIVDQTSNYNINIRKCVEAGNGKVQIFYMEFESAEIASAYIKNMYEKQEDYKINDNYTYVKSTKGKYFKLYRSDNVVIYGIALDKKDKREVKSTLKDLGY